MVNRYRPNNIKVSKNFILSEFESPDTHEVILVPLLLECLQKLRDRVGRPIIITSGYRTPKHNKKIKGAKKSYHLKGMAADIIVPAIKDDPKDPVYPYIYNRRHIAELALEAGFSTAILYKTKCHVHLDVREKGLGIVEMQ